MQVKIFTLPSRTILPLELDTLIQVLSFFWHPQNKPRNKDQYKDAKVADKIMRMNYDIHIGAIGGIVGKIIAFLVSLLAASLPVTGILLWYGRTYKKK